MKITVEQLRRIIREEIELVSENFNDDYREKIRKKQAIMIPALKKPEVPKETPMGKKRLPPGMTINDILDSLSPEQREELMAAMKNS